MFTIALIIAGIKSGTMHIVIPILFFLWFAIISCIPSKQQLQKKTRVKKNPIDKHGDEVYGTIDWLRDGKL